MINAKQITRWSSCCAIAIVGMILWVAAPAAHCEDKATPENKPAADAAKTSTFKIPSSLAEGHDPFYPKSTRFIAKPTPEPAVGPVVLELKGISGTPERPLAIINNRTFAIGEEQDVTTAQGKVKVRCLNIEGMKVRVMAQGQTQDLLCRTGI